MADGEKLIPINIVDEMKSSYIDYSMSVIVSRALPDVRDGLKPVHRRVLFGMNELGINSNSSYKKSARIVGEVLGKYHPHGDTSVYDTMVRMAQAWSLRYMLVDGQGNFGSVDGDGAAAMRYTEARMRRIAEDMMVDIDKETVDMVPNFDDTLKEPSVLPTRIPNLLVNGASGIAVGMATNMAPHNLTEVVNAIEAYIDNPECTADDLMEYVKAPDFPTGGIIYGMSGVREAFRTGRGRVIMRAKANIEQIDGRDCIVVTEIPYQVNKSEMIKRTVDLINDKKIEGISTIRDESDRSGMRIVYVIKREAVPNVVLNSLYKNTALQTSFSVNNIALVDGRPQLLNLRDLIHYFVEHRHDVVTRRCRYELRKAEERAHILEGLIIASDNIDEVVRIIRSSSSTDEAKTRLIERFTLSDVQARAIVEMRLRQLTGLEQEKLRAEYDEVQKRIENLKALLSDKALRMALIKEEMEDIKDRYGDERKSEIEYAADGDFSIEDMIADEEVVVTISHAGYIKRTRLAEYRVQGRGGVGQRGVTTREEDFLEHLFMATNHQYMLLFTEKGKVYWMRVYEIPEGAKTAKGRAIQNLINIEQDDKIRAYIMVDDLKDEEYINNHYVVMVTTGGTIKKTTLEAYSRPRANGINAINVREGDTLLEACLTTGESKIMLATSNGKAVRFDEKHLRPMGRTATGVIGVNLNTDEEPDNKVVGMICVDDEDTNVLVVSEKGYGKRSEFNEYRETSRGAKGVKTIAVTEKTGRLISIVAVKGDEDLMIVTRAGITIRMSVEDLRVMGRATQGVRLINLREGDDIASVAKVISEEDKNDEVQEVESPSGDAGEAAQEETV
ncbi:MAG: DNA gyrase subunit A [Flavobacteriales bacterium]|nr:DNA gyrase subunit A [Flavobacteriales bacterium]